MASGSMPKNENKIPHSAKYTAATWRWAGLPYAECVEPPGAGGIFKAVNAYMKLYRLINPKMYSLRHMLVQRHQIINEMLKVSDSQQFIELACGFSPRGSYMSELFAGDYFEIDLPEVVALKQELLQRGEQGKAVINRRNHKLEAGDILTIDFEKRFPKKRTFIITEGLMMYFSREEQLEIWRRIASFLRAAGGCYVFDYIPLPDEPKRSKLGLALRRFKNKMSKNEADLGFSYDERDRNDVKRDLLLAGFTRVEIVDGHQTSTIGQQRQRDANTPVLVFHCQ